MRSLAFEIIVLDVMMPGESGFDFAASLRQTSQVPILMLTARSESSDRVHGLEIGVDDYLAKPHEPKELLLRIGSILRRTRPAPTTPASPSSASGRSVFRWSAANCAPTTRSVRLTERERDMLRLLCANSRRKRLARGADRIGRGGE